jgi:LCP family protein required for cell wall assembly
LRGVALSSDIDSTGRRQPRGSRRSADVWAREPDGPAEQIGTEIFGGDGDDDGDGGRAEAAAKRRRKRGRRRVLISIGVIVVLLAGGAVGLAFNRQSAYDRNIKRIPGAFPTGPDRPAAGPQGVENWLLLGSDKRGPGDPGYGKIGGERADTIMLLHLPADHKAAYLVSFPRDAWVSIPGHGKTKINAAYAYGGSRLLIETIEKLTGVRIDHFGTIDFAGMRTMTDALGGVDVRVNQTIYDPNNKVTWKAGVNHLNGDLALKFVRQRYGLARGDFARIERQQAFLKALAKKAVSRGTFTNPLKLNAFLDALTKSVSVDDSVKIGHLRSRALSFRNLRAGDISFMTVPTRGTGRERGQSVVYLHALKSPMLFDALRRDRMGDYLKNKNALNRVDKVN